MSTGVVRERVDVVVIGARCAGSAAAIALARGGRSVLVVDRSPFPSDTLSTHANFPSAVAEMQALGMLPRVLRGNPPKCVEGAVITPEVQCISRWTPVDGINYGLSNPRDVFDQALVETAREHGAEVRERTSFVDLRWRAGRVCGVRLDGPDGSYEVDCDFVIGADGRRSSVAHRAGVDTPYRGSANDRALAFFYCDDPLAGTEWQYRMIQYRASTTHTLVFPCAGDRMVLLFMGPKEEIPAFRRDPEGMRDRYLAECPPAADRVAGATNFTKLRSTGSVSAYYRRSSGPGWALAGDAGHFKDPVIGQGMRDAMRFGRLLGEAIGPWIGDHGRTDVAALAVERRRDVECAASYHWGNRESRIIEPSALVKEAFRYYDGKYPCGPLEMFDRRRSPHRVLNPVVGAKLALKTALRPGTDRRALLAEVREELRIDIDCWRDELTKPFRPERVWASERPGFDWPSAAPAPPKRSAPADADRLTPAAV